MLVSRVLLEDLAEDTNNYDHSTPAAALLRTSTSLSATVSSAGGCTMAGNANEGQSLLRRLLDAGLVSVRSKGERSASIGIDYRADESTGSITYRLPDGTELFTHVWVTSHR